MEQQFFRDVVSFDWDDLITLIVALVAIGGLFVVRKSKSSTISEGHEIKENVDAGVLEQFRQLFERIAVLETNLARAQVTIEEARAEIREMQKIEEVLQAKVWEREKQIEELKEQLAAARERIAHLEAVCRRAGINGPEDSWDGVERRT